MNTDKQSPRRRMVLLVARADSVVKDLVAMTLGWMCAEADVAFDVYYAADHEHGGLFSKHGSTIIGGHHGARLARALAMFETTVVRLGSASIFSSLFDVGASSIVNCDDDLSPLYASMARRFGIPDPKTRMGFDLSHSLPPAVFYADCVQRRAAALPAGEVEPGERLDLAGDDPALACVQRHVGNCTGVDLYEPLLAGYFLAFNQRERRLILPYNDRTHAQLRRDQWIEMSTRFPSRVIHGRWFRDEPLRPLAKIPAAYNVIEPHRHVLSVFSRHPTPLPQPKQSWIDLEPSDDQLHTWAGEKRILASWVLHSGELSHDDSVLAFVDWAAMTKTKLGSGVHWQRYHFDPDVVEPLHVPVAEGGVLGLIEPVLHSVGSGIVWESAGDPQKIAAMMKASREKIAEIAGARFAPRGVYCFGDHEDSVEAQLALWEAIRLVGFEYVISNARLGPSRILFEHEGFVVLNQAGEQHTASPFVRGTPATFASEEKRLVEAGRPGWLIGAIDTPIHGCPIYVGRPFGGDRPQPRINDFFDYVAKGGVTGKVISVTPRVVARFARICQKGSP